MNKTNSEELSKILDEIVKRILFVVQPKRIILFGSSATGMLHRGSDIDIAVIVDECISKKKLSMDIYMALAGIGVPIDIIVLKESELDRYKNIKGTVLPEIVRYGRAIYHGLKEQKAIWQELVAVSFPMIFFGKTFVLIPSKRWKKRLKHFFQLYKLNFLGLILSDFF